MPPHRHHSRHLNEDDRRRVQTLINDARFSRRKVCEVTGFTMQQVRTAEKSVIVLPRSGRPRTISADEETELVAFVCHSQEKLNVQYSYAQLSSLLFEGRFGVDVIKRTLYRHGFRRKEAPRARGATAQEHSQQAPDSGKDRQPSAGSARDAHRVHEPHGNGEPEAGEAARG